MREVVPGNYVVLTITLKYFTVHHEGERDSEVAGT